MLLPVCAPTHRLRITLGNGYDKTQIATYYKD